MPLASASVLSRIPLKRAAEVFVGHQPANQQFDVSMHVYLVLLHPLSIARLEPSRPIRANQRRIATFSRESCALCVRRTSRRVFGNAQLAHRRSSGVRNLIDRVRDAISARFREIARNPGIRLRNDHGSMNCCGRAPT